MEETAHRFLPEALVGVYRYVYPPAEVTFLRFTFSGRSDGVEAGRALDQEIVCTHWLTRAEIAARADAHRTPLVMQCIEDHLAGRHFPLEVLSKEFS